jgi:hypothetical protein
MTTKKKCIRKRLAIALSCALASVSLAAWTPPDPSAWINITGNLSTSMANAGQDGSAASSPGVAVDRSSGYVFVLPANSGVWRSKDKGRTFAKLNTGAIANGSAYTITSYSIHTNGEGGKIAALFFGSSPCGFSSDTGNTWHAFTSTGDGANRNFEDACMNLDFDCNVVFGMGHEADLCLSSDSGKTWVHRAGPPNPWPGGMIGTAVFGPNILLGSNLAGETFRSTDAGETWTTIGNFGTLGPLTWFKGKSYWLCSSGLITTNDSGANWDYVGDMMPGMGVEGPFFGKDEKHMVVAAEDGFKETDRKSVV